MKHLSPVTTFLRYVPKRASLIGAITLGVLAPAVTFAWGPSRTTYTIEKPATHVVFNSITNNPVQGDERNFMQIREASAGNGSYADSVSLKPDTEYVVFVYYHNDANASLNGLNYTGKGVAKGAYVKAAFPNYVNSGQTKVNAEGYVGATGAAQVFDEVYFSNTTGSNLSLSYVKGSATIHNKGAANGLTMPDSIVTTGAKLGYDKLDGVVPGCNDYAGYVTFKVKTGGVAKAATTPAPATTAPAPATAPATSQATTDFTVQKDVRRSGGTTWADSVGAVPGDTIQYMITYKNTGSNTQSNVTLSDTLPAGVTYIAGSAKLKNGQHPTGTTVSDAIVGGGLNIGSYAGQGVGYVMFDATVSDSVQCGTVALTNAATVTSGNLTKSDTATVNITKTCQTAAPATTGPTTTPATTPTPVITAAPAAAAPAAQPVTTQPAVQPAATTAAPAVTATTPTAAPSSDKNAPAATPLPSTGPGDVLGGAFGAGSLGLGVHHYVASRRSLRDILKK